MNNKWTLRKWILLVYGLVALAATVVTYVLAFMGQETVTDLPLALIALFDAAYVAYLGADCLDHNSLNKYVLQVEEEESEDDEECQKCGFS